jgi:hypothetical protein
MKGYNNYRQDLVSQKWLTEKLLKRTAREVAFSPLIPQEMFWRWIKMKYSVSIQMGPICRDSILNMQLTPTRLNIKVANFAYSFEITYLKTFEEAFH